MKKLDGWLIYSLDGIRNTKNFIDTMLNKAKVNNLNVELICSRSCIIKSGQENELYINGEKVITYPKWAFMRTMNITLGRFLKSKGVTVINDPEAMVIAKDKMRTHMILSENNIATPDTVTIFKKTVTYKEVSNIMGNSSFVAKDKQGSQGRGVYLIHNEEDFKIVRKRTKEGKIFIYQEYIESTKGKDLRVYVLGNKVLGCVMRQSSDKEEFRANISQGGTSVSFPVDKKIKDIALKVASVFNFEFTGIDLLFTEKGYTVCEINSIAAFKSLNSLPDVTFSDEFYEYIKNKFQII